MSTQERNSRLQKLKNLKEQGISPYPNRYKPTHFSKDILESFKDEGEKTDVNIAGRVMLVRDFGKACFITVKDDKGTIQVYGQKEALDKYNVFKKLDAGDIIGVCGSVFRTQKGEITVNVSDFTLLAKALNPLPEKYHGLSDVEARYRQRYTDLIVNNDVKESFIIRAKALRFIRDFLHNKGFLEVETPMLQQIPGGANARPFETFHNALSIPLFLRIAPELYLKRLIVGGLDKVFELSRVFRNEGISTRHNPEFTLLEVYEAYSDYKGMMEMTEELLNTLVLSLFEKEEIEYQGTTLSFKRPFEAMSMKDAIKKYADIDIDSFKDNTESLINKAREAGAKIKPTSSYWKAVNEVFEELVEEKLTGPIFITHYPAETTPLAKQDPGNPDYVERFELFIAGREHANAYTELNDPIRQKENFERQVAQKDAGDDEAMYMDDDFVNALETGMPPTGGLGIGIDRLVMLLVNTPSIRDTILFPQLKPKTPLVPEKWKNLTDVINKFVNKLCAENNDLDRKALYKTIEKQISSILKDSGENKSYKELLKAVNSECSSLNDFLKGILETD